MSDHDEPGNAELLGLWITVTAAAAGFVLRAIWGAVNRLGGDE